MRVQDEAIATPCVVVVDEPQIFRAGLRHIIEKSFPKYVVQEADCLVDVLASREIEPALTLLKVHSEDDAKAQKISLFKERWPSSPLLVLADRNLEASHSCHLQIADALVSTTGTHHALVDAMSRLLNLGDTGTEDQNVQALSARQMEVLALMHRGWSNKIIARQLEISEFTVRGHVRSILKLFQVTSRSAACFSALEAGLLK